MVDNSLVQLLLDNHLISTNGYMQGGRVRHV